MKTGMYDHDDEIFDYVGRVKYSKYELIPRGQFIVMTADELNGFWKLCQRIEREYCAKVAEAAKDWADKFEIADAIRARGAA